MKWLRRRGHAAAWVTVDRGDVRLTRLAQHLAVALDDHTPGVAARLLPLLTQPEGPGPRHLGEAFGDALYDLSHDLVLVLDDVHLAMCDPTVEFLEGFMDAAPRRVRLVLGTRYHLPLRTAHLKVADDLVELSGTDLRFTEQETRYLLEIEWGTEIDQQLAGDIHRAVGGWPAAARLVALGLRVSGLPIRLPVPSFADVGRLPDYLAEQVLAGLDAGARQLLLTAALPERFNEDLLRCIGDMIGAQIGDAELRHLCELDLFRAEPGQQETWFRFHPLFRAIFLTSLASGDSELSVARRHQHLAQWFAERNLIGDAVFHLVANQSYVEAAHLITANVDTAFNAEDWRLVAGWLKHIPDAELLNSPDLLLTAAWVAYLGGRTGNLAQNLARLRELSSDASLSAAQHAEVAILTVACGYLYERDTEHTIRTVTRALDQLAPKRSFQAGVGVTWLVMAQACMGRQSEALQLLAEFTARQAAHLGAGLARGYFARSLLLWHMGSLDLCAQTSEAMLQLAIHHDLPMTRGWAELMLGDVAFERGQLSEAAEHYHRSIARAHDLHALCVREAYIGQILVYQLQGHPDKADGALQRYRALAHDAAYPEPLDFVDSLRAQLALMRGHAEAGVAWSLLPTQAAADPVIWTQHHPLVTRATVLIAAGHLDDAEPLLQEYLRRVRASGYKMGEMHGLVVATLLHEARGETTQADDALREAIRIAAPEGMVQRFLLLGDELVPVLRRLQADLLSWRFAQRLLQVIRRNRSTPSSTAEEARSAAQVTLTTRDHDILRCLEQRMTNNEIGDALFITPKTAKNYVLRICAKLGVSNRFDAVTRARLLGFVDADA